MAKCDVCGRAENMPYQCRYCGGTHCSSHRLPENHNCSGLENWNDPGGVFDSGFDTSIQTTSTSTSQSILDRLKLSTSTGGLIGYFRGNLTYLFLAMIWITFFLEWIVLILFPDVVFRSIFYLSSNNPHYVWTWFTSIFAHAPITLTHIVINSIVLFFFGPLVERRVSSKEFIAIFIFSGMAAGLSQITAAIMLGETSAVVGASGAVMALMGILTVLNPNLRVYLFFILPMPLWLLTIGFAIYSVFIAIGAGIGAGQVAHLAHLVGLVIGLVYGEKLRREGQRLPEELRLGPSGPGRQGPGRRRF